MSGLVSSGIPLAADAEDFTCKGQGKCVCTETINPASVLG